MRVAWVVPGFSADEGDWGIPALLDLARVLAERVDLHIFALRYPHRRGAYRVHRATVTAFGAATGQGGRSARLWGDALAAIRAEHRRPPFAVVHAFWAGETGLVAALAAHLIGCPCLVHLAGGELAALPDIGYGGWLTWRERLKTQLALSLATRISAGSEWLLSQARATLPARYHTRLSLAPLGIDPVRFHLPPTPYPSHFPSPPPSPLRLLHVASLSPVKDHPTLLRALALVRAGGVDARLDLVGGAPHAAYAAHLQRLAADLHVGDAVRWRGAVNHATLPAVYRAADLQVQSSRHEAQGMAVLEGAAIGLPSVGTRVGVLADLAPDAARAVPPRDPHALAEAIAALAAPVARLALTDVAQRRVLAAYTLEQTLDKSLNFYAGTLLANTSTNNALCHK